MARLVALYNTPKDPAAFDSYYETTHVDMAKKMPHLRSIELSKGQIATPGGAASYHRVGTLRFDSMEDLQKSLASPEGQATAADVMNFATGGVTLLFFDTMDF
jgi:uncharacterized protein (TIGR02118 family)